MWKGNVNERISAAHIKILYNSIFLTFCYMLHDLKQLNFKKTLKDIISVEKVEQNQD